MCGISGFNWNDQNLIAKMNLAIKHRGPDDEGFYTDEKASLGHVRLAIIDLSEAGHQPMIYSHHDRDVAIVSNGEVYNFQEIRTELKKRGYRFRSNTDTEVILASYLEWDFDCVRRFNGMWSFCIYDFSRKVFFCSRDRLGKKPFYYFFDGDRFIFSSELKGILEHKYLRLNRPENIDQDAVDLYFSLGFIPSPRSIYKNVFKLAARQNLLFDLNTKQVKRWYYYEIPKYDPIHDKEELVSQGKRILEDAVRLRMIADVPVGAFLSGGLDSSTVVGVMKDLTDISKLHTFSIGFQGSRDESYYMNIVKDYFGTRHHSYYFTDIDLEKLLHIYSHVYDEPFCDYSGFPTYKISEITRPLVTVALSGDGADEVFGGYGNHLNAYRIGKIKTIPKFLLELIANLSPKKFLLLREAVKISLLPEHKYYSETLSEYRYNPAVCQKWIEANLSEMLHLSQNNLPNAIILNDLLYLTLPDYYLVKVDRASMAHALEVRSPFLDYRFIELNSKIPVEWKINIFKTKILMREIIKNIVPEKIVNRGKQGFDPPIEEWLLNQNFDFAEITRKLNSAGVFNESLFEFLDKRASDNNETGQRYFTTYKVRLLLFHNWLESWAG